MLRLGRCIASCQGFRSSHLTCNNRYPLRTPFTFVSRAYSASGPHDGWTVLQLKEELRSRGLKVSGSKAELLQRLGNGGNSTSTDAPRSSSSDSGATITRNVPSPHTVSSAPTPRTVATQTAAAPSATAGRARDTSTPPASASLSAHLFSDRSAKPKQSPSSKAAGKAPSKLDYLQLAREKMGQLPQAQQQAQRLNSAADARSARAQVFEALQESRSSDLSSMRASQPDGDTMAELPESLASNEVLSSPLSELTMTETDDAPSKRAKRVAIAIMDLISDAISRDEISFRSKSLGVDFKTARFTIRTVRLGSDLSNATVLWTCPDPDRIIKERIVKKAGSADASNTSESSGKASRRLRRITLKEVVTNALRDNVPKLRYMMGERLNLKFVPQLIFQFDEVEQDSSFAQGMKKLEELKQTLAAPPVQLPEELLNKLMALKASLPVRDKPASHYGKNQLKRDRQRAKKMRENMSQKDLDQLEVERLNALDRHPDQEHTDDLEWRFDQVDPSEVMREALAAAPLDEESDDLGGVAEDVDNDPALDDVDDATGADASEAPADDLLFDDDYQAAAEDDIGDDSTLDNVDWSDDQKRSEHGIPDIGGAFKLVNEGVQEYLKRSGRQEAYQGELDEMLGISPKHFEKVQGASRADLERMVAQVANDPEAKAQFGDMSTEMITSQLRTALQTMSPKEYSDMLRGRVLAETDRTVHKQLLAGPNQLKALPKPHVSKFAPQKSSRTDQDA